MTPIYRKLVALGIVLALVVLTGFVLLGQPAWCVSSDGSPVGCAEVTLIPSEATGDFYVDGVLVAPALNIGQLVLVPDVDHTIEIKNIQSTEADFGTLFTYNDVSLTLKVKAGEAKTKGIKLVKNYIRGTLSFTCDVKGAAAADVVSCRITIDGAVQPDVAAGESAPYVLDPGDRAVLVEVIGDQTGLFDPANKQQTVRIAAGKTATLKVTFTKKGHLFLALDQAGVVTDFYVDGAQVATQVATFDMWVAPNKNHKAEAKNFNDPAAAGVYSWKDASQSTTVKSGVAKTVTFKLQKKYLKGFLELTCNIKNAADAPAAYCEPTIDGALQPPVLAGATIQYVLDLGKHSVRVALGPAGVWTAAPVTNSPNIQGGKTVKFTATFAAEVPTYPITLVNNATTSICYVFITPNSSTWGPNQLASGQKIGAGSKKVFKMPAGNYSLHAEDCGKNPFDYTSGITLPAEYTWTVTNRPLPPGPTAKLTFKNSSSTEICQIFVAPTGQPWGWDWLGIQRTLPPGQRVTFTITDGSWDFMAMPCYRQDFQWDDYGFQVSGSWTWNLID